MAFVSTYISVFCRYSFTMWVSLVLFTSFSLLYPLSCIIRIIRLFLCQSGILRFNSLLVLFSSIIGIARLFCGLFLFHSGFLEFFRYFALHIVKFILSLLFPALIFKLRHLCPNCIFISPLFFFFGSSLFLLWIHIVYKDDQPWDYWKCSADDCAQYDKEKESSDNSYDFKGLLYFILERYSSGI